jgi:hypothetical protein
MKMRAYQWYLLSVAVSFSFTTFALALLNETQLDLYVSLYIIEFFVLTLLQSPLKPRTSRLLDFTGYALFAVFVVIVAFRVYEILFGFIQL